MVGDRMVIRGWVVVAAMAAGCMQSERANGGSDAAAGHAGGGAGGETITGGGGSVITGEGEGGATGDGGTGGGNGGGGGEGGTPADGGMDAAGTRGGDGGTGGEACPGMALTFDGATAYGTVARMVQDDFTIEAWIKTTASRAGTYFYQGNGLIYADVVGVANDFGTSILNNKFALGIGNPDATLVSTTDVTSGAWTHVAATRNKATGEVQVLVNGAVEASMISTQVGTLDAQPMLTIGANRIDGHYFSGTLDEVRIWNVTRSAAAIVGTMHQRLKGDEAGLVAYWRFDDGTGATAADSAAGGLNAITLNGSNGWTPSDAPVCP